MTGTPDNPYRCVNGHEQHLQWYDRNGNPVSVEGGDHDDDD